MAVADRSPISDHALTYSELIAMRRGTKLFLFNRAAGTVEPVRYAGVNQATRPENDYVELRQGWWFQGVYYVHPPEFLGLRPQPAWALEGYGDHTYLNHGCQWRVQDGWNTERALVLPEFGGTLPQRPDPFPVDY